MKRLIQRSLIVLVVLLTGILLVSPAPAQAQGGRTYLVNTTADAPAVKNNGQCVTAANTCSLRAAIMAANANPGLDIIQLPAGTYSLTRTGGEDSAVSGDLDILDALVIDGSGAANTVVDANQIDDAFHVPVDNGLFTLLIEGVTIRGASGSLQHGLRVGGGAKLILLNSIIRDNRGGVEVVNDAEITNVLFSNNTYRTLQVSNASTVFVTNSRFLNNAADGSFAAIIRNFGTLTITNSLIANNTYAGIYTNGGLVRLYNSRISGNTSQSGAGIYSVGEDGRVEISGSVISGNAATLEGGGIYNFNSTMTINDSLISGNTADAEDIALGNGGGIYNDGTMSITNTLIEGNVTYGDFDYANGGGIYNEGTLSVTSSTFSGNRSVHAEGQSWGGALTTDTGALSDPVTSLVNVTFTNNTADYGGALSVGSGTLNIVNTIAAGNTANADPADADCLYTGGTITSGGSNLIGRNGSCGGAFSAAGDRVGVNPLLAPLANNGGFTRTHALQPGSPAVNTANAAACPPTDQRRAARAGGCDIGAFEQNGAVPAPGTDPNQPGNLVANGGFDLGTAGWVLNGSGGKVKVNANGTFYQAKAKNGRANATLKQAFTPWAGQLNPGDVLTVGGTAAIKNGGKSKLTVRADGVKVLKIKVPAGANQPFSFTTPPLASVPATIEVKFKQKFTRGKVRLDNLTLVRGSGAQVPTAVTPPEAAPVDAGGWFAAP